MAGEPDVLQDLQTAFPDLVVRKRGGMYVIRLVFSAELELDSEMAIRATKEDGLREMILNILYVSVRGELTRR